MAKYHMKRKEREITDEQELWQVLAAREYATLGLCRGNEPYVVTLNYGLDLQKQALFFHCVSEGLKMDFLRENPQVCGTVIEDQGYLTGECNHLYRSVVFWGELREITDLHEKHEALNILIDHLESEPQLVKDKFLQTTKAYEKVAILRLDISHLSGRQGA